MSGGNGLGKPTRCYCRERPILAVLARKNMNGEELN